MIWPTRRGPMQLPANQDTPRPGPVEVAPTPKVVKMAAQPEVRRLDQYTELKVNLHQKLIERINQVKKLHHSQLNRN